MAFEILFQVSVVDYHPSTVIANWFELHNPETHWLGQSNTMPLPFWDPTQAYSVFQIGCSNLHIYASVYHQFTTGLPVKMNV